VIGRGTAVNLQEIHDDGAWRGKRRRTDDVQCLLCLLYQPSLFQSSDDTAITSTAPFCTQLTESA